MKSMLSNGKSAFGRQPWDVVLFSIAECFPQQVETILTGDVVNSFFDKDTLVEHAERMDILQSMLTVPGVDFLSVLPCLEKLLDMIAAPPDAIGSSNMFAIVGVNSIALRFHDECAGYLINNPQQMRKIVELMQNNLSFCAHVLHLFVELARLNEGLTAQFKALLLDETNILAELSHVLDQKDNLPLVNSALRMLAELTFVDILTGVRVLSHGELLQQVKGYLETEDMAVVLIMGTLE